MSLQNVVEPLQIVLSGLHRKMQRSTFLKRFIGPNDFAMGELARDPSSILSSTVVNPDTAAASVTDGFGQPVRGQGTTQAIGSDW